MYKHFITLILSIMLICLDGNVYATPQLPDLLVIKKDTFSIYPFLLEEYLTKNNKTTFCGIELESTSTSCYRGYVAIWEIKKGKLYLKNVFKPIYPHKIQFNLVKEFGKHEIIADWYSGKLLCPKGRELQEFYLGTLLHEKEVIYTISKGKIKHFYTKNNLVYNKNLLNPCIDILKDTLKMRILKSIDFSEIEKIASKDIAEIYVRFNEKGLIENIELNEYSTPSQFDTYLLSVAQKALKNLPRLMQVTAENYQPPSVVLTFEGKCFKSPELYKNVCSDCLKLNQLKNGKNDTLVFGIVLSVLILVFLLFGIAPFLDKLKI